jgi:peptidoglycan hydrolase CwlO-like protein
MLTPGLSFKWIAVGLIALALVAGAYRVVQMHRDTIAENQTLKTQLTQAEHQITSLEDQQARLNAAIDSNAKAAKAIQTQRDQRSREIARLPQTQACVEQPAIAFVLGELQNEQVADE